LVDHFSKDFSFAFLKGGRDGCGKVDWLENSKTLITNLSGVEDLKRDWSISSDKLKSRVVESDSWISVSLEESIGPSPNKWSVSNIKMV